MCKVRQTNITFFQFKANWKPEQTNTDKHPSFSIKLESIKARTLFTGLWSLSSNLATFTSITMWHLPDWLQALCCLFTCCFWIVSSLFKVIKYFHITLTLHYNGWDRNSKSQTDWLILREWVSSHKTTHYINKALESACFFSNLAKLNLVNKTFFDLMNHLLVKMSCDE